MTPFIVSKWTISTIPWEYAGRFIRHQYYKRPDIHAKPTGFWFAARRRRDLVIYRSNREAEGHAIRIAGTAVVHATAAIHITEVSVVVAISRTQPPTGGRSGCIVFNAN